ncbi:MAG: ABC transporter permease [Defluviitaleaceae bacterium]|nr:ABC transporter permease [Defluviitaleaceae bacterium]
MQTFKCFFKIVKANFFTMIMYTGIFIVLTLLIGVFFTGGLIRFERISANIAIVNRDNHPLSQGLLDYLETIHTLIPMEDEMSSLEDAIFFMHVQFALIIDENFGADFANSGNSKLLYVAPPNTLDRNIYIRRQIDTFMQTVMGYLTVGFDYDEAISLAKQDQLQLVTLLQPEEDSSISLYFGSLVYLFKSLIVIMVGIVLMVFREKDLASRLEVSPTTPKYRTLWLSLACGTASLAMWAFVMIIGYFLHHESLFSVRGGLHMINSLVLVIVCVCIGILLTRIVKDVEFLVRIATLVAILAAFASGMFVPHDQMDGLIQTVARFTPGYWYGNNDLMLINDFIGREVINMSEFWVGIGIQLCFAAALFAIALVLGREKKQA